MQVAAGELHKDSLLAPTHCVGVDRRIHSQVVLSHAPQESSVLTREQAQTEWRTHRQVQEAARA